MAANNGDGARRKESYGPLPRECQQVVAAFLEALDRLLPGRVCGLLLVGSLALEDYLPGRSDIDFVAVIDDELDVSKVAEVHLEITKLHPDPGLDGIYVAARDLSRSPAGTGIYVRNARMFAQSSAERHPPAWMIMRDHAIAVRGPHRSAYDTQVDQQDVAAFSRHNLATYWRDWVLSRSAAGVAPITDDEVVWGTLGVCRLDAAIHAGSCFSKTAAGRAAVRTFPAHYPILREALHLRQDGKNARSGYASPRQRHDDAIAFMTEVMSAASVSRPPLEA